MGISSKYLVAKGTGLTDTIGANTRDLYQLQYLFASGAALDLTNAAIGTANTIKAGYGGDAIPVFATGKMTIPTGKTLWSFTILDGNGFVFGSYEFGVANTATYGQVFDTSGNGRHLTFTVTNTALVCLSRRVTGGSNTLDMRGWSKRENVKKPANGYTGNTDIEITSLDDGWFKLSKLKDTNGGSININTLETSLHPDAQATSYIFRCKLKASPTSITNSLSLGFYFGGWSGLSISILSGPGTTSITGWCNVMGLSATEETVIEVTKNNYVIGGTAPIFNIYPTTVSGEANTGDGILIKEGQICVGDTAHDYIDVFTRYIEQPSTTNGLPSSVGKIVCLGDSLTAGYVPYLQKLHPLSTCVSAGVGGDTTAMVKARVQASVIDAGANVCVLLAGINDAYSAIPLATAQQNILDIISMCEAAGVTMVLSTMTPSKGNSAYTAGIQTFTDDFNTWVRTLGRPVAELYTAVEDPATPDTLLPACDSNDGTHIHFSNMGQRVQASVFALLIPGVSYSAGDVYNKPTQYPGRAKYNIKPISSTGDTAIIDANTYQLADTAEMRNATGWTGTANTFFNADGTPTTLTGSALKAAGVGPVVLVGTTQWAVFKDAINAVDYYLKGAGGSSSGNFGSNFG